jgi:hypothetical protein
MFWFYWRKFIKVVGRIDETKNSRGCVSGRFMRDSKGKYPSNLNFLPSNEQIGFSSFAEKPVHCT